MHVYLLEARAITQTIRAHECAGKCKRQQAGADWVGASDADGAAGGIGLPPCAVEQGCVLQTNVFG
jgi:hypothetical protein